MSSLRQKSGVILWIPVNEIRKNLLMSTYLWKRAFPILSHDPPPSLFSVQCYWQGVPLSGANFGPASTVVIMTKKVLSHNIHQTCRNWATVTSFRSDDHFLKIVRSNELILFGNTVQCHSSSRKKRSKASLFSCCPVSTSQRPSHGDSNCPEGNPICQLPPLHPLLLLILGWGGRISHCTGIG